MERIEIPMKLPSLNDYIKVCRSNKFYANKFKQQYEQQIGLYLIKLKRYQNPVKITFTWVEETKRRDLDNVAFAKKFILDAMVKFEKLKDDNRKYVTAFEDKFEYGKENKVILDISEVKKNER